MSAAPVQGSSVQGALACGSVRLEVAGAEATLRPSGALWLEAERALVVADLHLEKGSAYAARGQMLPPYDTRETLERLAAEAQALAPALIVLLGDTLHDGRAEGRMAAEDAARIAALAQGRSLVWIVGNHDVDGPASLAGETVQTLNLCGLTLRHEPEPGPQPGEVAGHLHPCARIGTHGPGRARAPYRSGGLVRRRCFLTDGRRLILPAFGAYAGGLNVRDRAFEGLFAAPPTAAALGRGRVHAVGWSRLHPD